MYAKGERDFNRDCLVREGLCPGEIMSVIRFWVTSLPLSAYTSYLF